MLEMPTLGSHYPIRIKMPFIDEAEFVTFNNRNLCNAEHEKIATNQSKC